METEARKRANYKYKLTQKQISIRIKPELYARIEAAAKTSGMSVRGFILSAVDDKINEVASQSASSELTEQDDIDEKSEREQQ